MNQKYFDGEICKGITIDVPIAASGNVAMSRINEIRAREQAATPGPWFPEGWAMWDDESDEYEGLNDEDSYFIAHSREDVPFLLDEISRLTAQVEQMERAICDRCEFCVVDCAKPGECTGWRFDYERFAGGGRE